MIKLRPRPEVPSTLKSSKVRNLKRKIAEKAKAGVKPKSEDFKPDWLKDDVRNTLYKHHQGKCCYCERKRELKRESDVEHYRPKAGVTEDKPHFGYWWLAYEWANYLIACKPCNQAHKANHFPLLPGGKRAQGPNDSLYDEKPFLINPIDDEPEKYIGFEWQSSEDRFVMAIGLDSEGRGEKTLKLTDLNRPNLMEERAGLILTLRGMAIKMSAGKHFGNETLINDAAKEIKKETAAREAFAGFRRIFFRQMGLYEYVSKE